MELFWNPHKKQKLKIKKEYKLNNVPKLKNNKKHKKL